jgi:hypothetical protein
VIAEIVELHTATIRMVYMVPQVTSNDFVLDPRFPDIAPVGFNAGGIEAEQKGILIVKMRKNQVHHSQPPQDAAPAEDLSHGVHAKRQRAYKGRPRATRMSVKSWDQDRVIWTQTAGASVAGNCTQGHRQGPRQVDPCCHGEPTQSSTWKTACLPGCAGHARRVARTTLRA